MSNFNWVGILSILFTSFLIFSCSPEKSAYKNRMYSPGDRPDRIMQNVSGSPSTELAFAWRSKPAATTAFAEIAAFSNSSDFHESIRTIPARSYTVGFDDFEDHYYKVNINSLEPDTRYLVRVGSEEHRSEWFETRTAPAQFEPFTFIYLGDTQNDIIPYAPRVYRSVAQHFPEARFVMHAGDLVLSSGNDDTWGEFYESGSWLFRQIPQFPSTGNSDHNRWKTEPVDTRKLYDQWHVTFNLPQNSPPGLENVTYYVDYPGIRLISLYSNFESISDDRVIMLSDEVEVTPELVELQTEWLRETLASNTQPWTAVVYHHPVYTARENRENEWLRDSWKPLFEEFGVDLVLQGHDHLYARGHGPDSLSTGNAIPVYTISVAGPKMRDIDQNHTWFDVAHQNLQMYQAIHLSSDTLHYQAFHAGREIADEFMIIRNGDGQKSFTDLYNN